jgi:hypothetical protein
MTYSPQRGEGQRKRQTESITRMKLSWLAGLVGIKEPAKATEQDIVTALETTVAAANETKPVLDALRKAMKKEAATVADVLTFANAITDKGPGGEGKGEGTAVVPHEGMNGVEISKLKLDLANCLELQKSKANEIHKLEGEITGIKAQVATLTNERDEARTAKTALETSFVNERKLRTGLLIEIGLKTGKLLLNEKDGYEKDFANVATFDSAMERYEKAVGGISKLKVTSLLDDAGTRNSTEGGRQNKIATLVNEVMDKEGLDYTKAFCKVKAQHADLFAGMKDPQDEQKTRINTAPKK